mmetsp:Transcript_43672/g.72578  ORF Transcript_43672/g.72578 Transcript_43672/m.72578 type:complete len:688 (-) Transcript_43672:115-2178(-)
MLSYCALSASSGWVLQTVQKLDQPAGRYTQVRTSIDGRPTMVWNGCGPVAGLRFCRCSDPTCSTWAPAITLPIDSNPRFIRMEFILNLPTFVYSACNGTELHLTRCADQDCKRMQTRTIARAETVRHPGLAGTADGQILVAAELSNSTVRPRGCSLILLRFGANLTLRHSSVIDRSEFPYAHKSLLPSGGFEMPCLIGGGSHLAYWRAESQELVLVFWVDSSNASALVVDSNRTATSSPGAWTRGVSVENGATLILAFWDVALGYLLLARCTTRTRRCSAPEVADQTGRRDLSDFGAGAFPDFQMQPAGTGRGPVLAYFSEDDASTSGMLKLLTCADPRCNDFEVTVGARGKPGFGRDASVSFAAATMIVTFLDLQGNDSELSMVARFATFKPGHIQGATLMGRAQTTERFTMKMPVESDESMTSMMLCNAVVSNRGFAPHNVTLIFRISVSTATPALRFSSSSSSSSNRNSQLFDGSAYVDDSPALRFGECANFIVHVRTHHVQLASSDGANGTGRFIALASPGRSYAVAYRADSTALRLIAPSSEFREEIPVGWNRFVWANLCPRCGNVSAWVSDYQKQINPVEPMACCGHAINETEGPPGPSLGAVGMFTQFRPMAMPSDPIAPICFPWAHDQYNGRGEPFQMLLGPNLTMTILSGHTPVVYGTAQGTWCPYITPPQNMYTNSS